jgi:gamma-glutamyltranspeptidase/glutathione hydrolase
MRRLPPWLLAAVTTFFVATLVFAVAAAPPPSSGRNGAVATGHYLATEAGMEVLRAGGNAIDAAVAAALALGVVQQRLSGIGGDGVALIYLASRREVTAINFLGRAPLAATPAAFGAREEWVTGYKSAVVPGDLGGLWVAHERFGKLPWFAVVQPAIRLAAGFPATSGLANSITSNAALLLKDPESAKIYLPGGRAPRSGETFAQPDLRRTLELIARGGRQVFYAGEIADAVVGAMAERGGLIAKEDLSRYQPASGTPLRIRYRAYEVVSVLPPAGGVEVLEALKILEGFDLPRLSDADRLHVVASAIRIAFADRAAYKGDPAIAKYPVVVLLSDAYTEKRREDIVPGEAAPDFAPGNPADLGIGGLKLPPREVAYRGPGNTSHLVTADREGNMVSLTQTMGPGVWGSGVTIPGTGVMLNATMSNFSTRADSPRRLVGGSIRNSSMAATMVLRNGVPVLLVGAAGNEAIIGAVVQIIVNLVDLGLGVEAAVAAGRILPDEGRQLLVERRVPQSVRDALATKGYHVEVVEAIANSQALQVVNGLFQGVTDPRSPGGAYAY